MKLTDEQLKSVAAWFAAGASLDEIQKRLVAEYGVHITYFDLRMIVAELPQPEDPEVPEDPEDPEDPEVPEDPESPENLEVPEDPESPENLEVPEDPESPENPENPETPENGVANVTVTVDALMIPGTMASGDVTFSDGVKGKWYLDQMGRLGLGGDLPQGYRPSPADAALFQARLMEALRAKGLC